MLAASLNQRRGEIMSERLHQSMKRRPSRSDVSLIVLVLLIDSLNVAIAHAAERGDFGGLVDSGNGCGK